MRWIVNVMILLSLFMLCVPAAHAGEGSSPVRVIVAFHGEPDLGIFSRYGGRAVLELHSSPAVAGVLPAEVLAKVQALDEVDYVVEDGVVKADGAPSPSMPASGKGAVALVVPPEELTWGIARIKAPAAWGLSRGFGVRVAVLDTGIENTHPDFRGYTFPYASRVVLGPSFVEGVTTSLDDHNHGTHVAGIIGASLDDAGVAGVAPYCTPVAVKVLDANGDGQWSWIIAGIDWAVANNCQVINMSLGSQGGPWVQAIQAACDQAVAAGVVVVAAAGNSGDTSNWPEFPGAVPSVVCVAATDEFDQRASFSNYGGQVDIAAPGVNIWSTVRVSRGSYASWDGTSMATPHVAGTAALMIAGGRYGDRNANGHINDEVIASLARTADDINAPTLPGRDDYLGNGLVDSREATFRILFTPRLHRLEVDVMDESLSP